MPSTPAMGMAIGMDISCPGCWARSTRSTDSIYRLLAIGYRASGIGYRVSADFERESRPFRFVVEASAMGAFHVNELDIPSAGRVERHLRHARRIGSRA